jgi:hypothetical protein
VTVIGYFHSLCICAHSPHSSPSFTSFRSACPPVDQQRDRDKHVAVTIKNLDPLVESLKKHNVAYSFSQSGRRAVFLRDIDQNALEFVEQLDM